MKSGKRKKNYADGGFVKPAAKQSTVYSDNFKMNTAELPEPMQMPGYAMGGMVYGNGNMSTGGGQEPWRDILRRRAAMERDTRSIEEERRRREPKEE